MDKQLTMEQRDVISLHFPDIAYHIVGIAASQGGLSAISTVLSGLPSDFPAAILVVQHLSPNYPSHLVSILSDRTSLQVKQAQTGELLRPGTVYTAIPNHHLLVTCEGTLYLSNSAKMNFVRPAADKLLMSMATACKARAIGVILTGRGSDGALGAQVIKRYGGTVIAQNEATSECFSMPESAIKTGKVDFVLPIEAIAPKLVTSVVPSLYGEGYLSASRAQINHAN